MTTQILSEETKLILQDGTVIDIDEEFMMIWFHPDGKWNNTSYRLNLKKRKIDVGDQVQHEY